MSSAEPVRNLSLLAPQRGQPQSPRNQLVTSGSSALPSASWSPGCQGLELCLAPRVQTSIWLPPYQTEEAWNKGESVWCWLGACRLTPSLTSLLEVAKLLSLVTSVPGMTEPSKAPGWTRGLREAVSRLADPALATKTNLQLLPLSEGGVEWSRRLCHPATRPGSSR